MCEVCAGRERGEREGGREGGHVRVTKHDLLGYCDDDDIIEISTHHCQMKYEYGWSVMLQCMYGQVSF